MDKETNDHVWFREGNPNDETGPGKDEICFIKVSTTRTTICSYPTKKVFNKLYSEYMNIILSLPKEKLTSVDINDKKLEVKLDDIWGDED